MSGSHAGCPVLLRPRLLPNGVNLSKTRGVKAENVINKNNWRRAVDEAKQLIVK